jgi:hypothetical protein
MDVSSVAQCVVAYITPELCRPSPSAARERPVMPERRQQMVMGKWHYQVINVRHNNRFHDNKPQLR